MILNYSIQNIKDGNFLLGIALKSLNKTDVFNFLGNLPELETEIKEETEESCLFYIEDEEGVVFTRFISNHETANTVKDKLVDFVVEKRSSFAKFKEVFRELAKAAAGATQHTN